jgi:hypothetical protein
MTESVKEWVRVGETTIVALDTGEVLFDDREIEPMTGAGTLVTTTGLLNGAISLAFEQTESSAIAEGPSPLPYIYSLVGVYHTAKDTQRNLSRAAQFFKGIGRPEVTEHLEMRGREEAGHERLALKDLSALGLPAERTVANLVPVGIKPLCDQFERLCFKDYPIESIGFSYCSERIAALKSEAEVDAVQSLFTVDATRFLRTHSGLGSEVSHVEETAEFVASLPAEDRIKVVRAVYETALLMADGRRLESSKSEADIRRELEQAAGVALPRYLEEALAAA